MIYKVLIFAAATLITVDARACFPDASGKTLEQLIGELKDIEKVRHDAIVKAAEKPQFKADENMVRYLATWTEYDALLMEIRKALKDIPWLLDGDKLEATYKQDPRKAFPFSVLRSPDGLIEDLEPLEVERHWAVVATMKIHELKDDQLKSKFLSTWSEFDAGLAIARKVFTEIIGLLKSGQEGQPPPSNGKSLEQLIREFKDMEKIRHDALQVVLNKPEYKEDENMVKYMATLTELDRVLVDTRKAIKDVPSILNPTEISTDMVDSKGVLDTLRRLRSESEILKVRLTEEGKAVSVDVLGDNEVQMLMASFGVSGKKLVEIGLKMLMEIFTAQSYMRGMSYNNSPSVSTSYKNGLSVPVANNVY